MILLRLTKLSCSFCCFSSLFPIYFFTVFLFQCCLLSCDTRWWKLTQPSCNFLSQLLISTFCLSVLILSPGRECPALSNDCGWRRFSPVCILSFLGTFHGTLSFLAISCLIYRAANAWWCHRLWLKLRTRQSLAQGSVYKHCCSICLFWQRSYFAWHAFWDPTLKLTF